MRRSNKKEIRKENNNSNEPRLKGGWEERSRQTHDPKVCPNLEKSCLVVQLGPAHHCCQYHQYNCTHFSATVTSVY